MSEDILLTRSWDWSNHRLNLKMLGISSPNILSTLAPLGLVRYFDADSITGLADGDPAPSFVEMINPVNNATAAGAARATYKTNIFNGKPALLFDGAANFYATPTIDLTGTQALTIIAVLMPDTSAAIKTFLSSTAFYAYHSTVNDTAIIVTGNGGSSFVTNTLAYLNSPAVVSILLDKAPATDVTRVLVNGVDRGASTSADNTDTFGNLAHNIGRRLASGVQWYKGYISKVLIFNRLLTDAEEAQVRNLLSADSLGIASELPSDNAYSASFSGYTLRSALSRVVFQTTATNFTVEYYNNIYSNFANYTSIGVIVDGVYTATIAGTVNAKLLTGSVSGLATGLKTIELINGLESDPSGTVLGTWVQRIIAPATISLIAPTEPGNRLIIYGDSITVGANSTTPTSDAWSMLVRAAYTGSVGIEAWGYRALKDDAVDATARAAFVAHLAASWNPSKIWLSIGTNDYGIASEWSASNFGVAYAALLDALHAQFPAAAIYAQTPLTRTSEVANGYGDTLGAYRTQISTAQSTRSGYCTLVDGTTMMTGNPAGGDGIHPDTAQHIEIANAAKTALGI